MKDTELIRSNGSGVDAVTYSYGTMVPCECLLTSLDTSWVSLEEVCLPSFDVVNCLLK